MSISAQSFKRTMAKLLVLAMILSMLPMSVLASEEDMSTFDSNETEVVVSADDLQSDEEADEEPEESIEPEIEAEEAEEEVEETEEAEEEADDETEVQSELEDSEEVEADEEVEETEEVVSAPSAIDAFSTDSGFGSDGVELAAGTYEVSVALMNSSDSGATSSNAAGVLADTAELTVDDDGNASLALTLQSTTLNSFTAYLTSMSYYTTYSGDGDTVSATDVEYDTVTTDMLVAATVAVNDTTEDGVYIYFNYPLYGMSMNLTAIVAIDYASATLLGSDDGDDNDDDTDVGIADGVYTVAITSAVDAAGSSASIAAILPETVTATVADGVINYEVELGAYVNLYYATQVLLCTADNYPNGTEVTVTSTVDTSQGSTGITGISFDYEGSIDDLLYLYVYTGDMSLFSRTLEITLDWDNAVLFDGSEDDSEDDGKTKFGSSNVSLDVGTYDVAVELIASSQSGSSIIADLLVNTAELTVNDDGSANIRVGFQYAEIATYGVSSASDIYYSDTRELMISTATTLATDVIKDDTGSVLYATLPIVTFSADGIYLLLQVDSISTSGPSSAWMVIDYEGIDGAIVTDDDADDDTEIDIEDGVYSVPLYVAKYAYQFKDYTSTDEGSMSNAAVEPYVIANVVDGKASYTMQFKSLILYSLTGHLTQLWTYPETVVEEGISVQLREDRVEVTDVSYKTDVGLDDIIGEFIEYATFDYAGELTDNVYIQVNVDAMATLGSGIQQAVLVLDWSEAVALDSNIKSIAVNSTTHATENQLNGDIFLTNLTIEVIDLDGKTETVEVTTDMISGYDSSELVENQIITITYEGKTTSYVVDIVESASEPAVDTTFDSDYTVEFAYLKTTENDTSTMASYMATTDVPVKENDDGTFTLAFDFYNYYASTGVTALEALKYDVDGEWVDLELIDVSGEYAAYDNAEFYARAYVTLDVIEEILFQAYIIPMADIMPAYATQPWRATPAVDTTFDSDYTTEFAYLKTGADSASSMASYMVTTDVPVKENDDGTFTLAFDFYNYYAQTGVTALEALKYDVDGEWVDLELINVSGEYAAYDNAEFYARAYVTLDAIEDITFQAYIIPMAAIMPAYATQSWRAAPVVATGIAVSSTDHVTEYYKGDELNVTGLTIDVVYNSGKTVAVVDAVTADMISGFDSDTIGAQKLTITYTFDEEEFTTTYDIFFNAKATSGSAVDNMTDVLEAESELLVENSNDGISAQFSSEAVAAIVGENTSSAVVVTLAEVKDTENLTDAQKEAVGEGSVFEFTVTVGEAPVTDFDADVTITIPYTLKDSENAKGLVIWHIAEDGTITAMPCTYDAVAATITFVTTHFSVYATSYDPSLVVTAIAVNSTAHKTSYTVGDSLSVSGLTIEATKEDTSDETVSVTAEMVTGFDSSAAGSQRLTITYEGFTATYDITVTAASTGGSGSSGSTTDDEDYDGKYSVPVSVKKFMTTSTTYKSSSENSMANDAVLETALADVDGDEITYTVWFTGLELSGLYGHLLNMWYYTAEDADDGSLDDPQAAKINSYFYDYGLEGLDSELEKFPESITFTYEGSVDDIVYIMVEVDAMSSDEIGVGMQNAVLLFDWDDAEKGSSGTSGNSGSSGSLAGSTDDDEEDTDDDETEVLSEEEVAAIAETIGVFDDVTEDDWFAGAVAYVLTNELFSGVTETEFSPNSDMTRAMLMTVLHRMSGDESFADGEEWFTDGMDWAVEMGISDGTDLDGSITREQLVTMIYRYAVAEAVETELDAFEDFADVSDWAVEAMAWAVEMGLLTGKTETTLAPTDTATRAEVATIVMRYLNSIDVEEAEAE